MMNNTIEGKTDDMTVYCRCHEGKSATSQRELGERMEVQRETMSMRPLKTPVFIDPTMGFTSLYIRIVEVTRELVESEYKHWRNYWPTADKIIYLARASEQWAEKHGLQPVDRTGLKVVNGGVGHTTKSFSTNMAVCLERKPNGWYWIGLQPVEVGPFQIIPTQYFLTPEQDALVKEWREREYSGCDDTVLTGELQVEQE